MADRRVTIGKIAGNYLAFGLTSPIDVPIPRGFVEIGSGDDARTVLGYVSALRGLRDRVRSAYPQDGITFVPSERGLTIDEQRVIRSLNDSKNGYG